ncbi:UDP-glucuronic acid decarboxylase family protein [Cryptosporangium japonicum]|uniref:GDP-mannose 4,6-dehydratase n=1 Tax=Cryptosporangium japonicum TaxID=80872 RepID=A0ABP3DRQ3_9ACTN
MYVVVTGGAGFLGSHLCGALLERGDRVLCVDDFSTGRAENISEYFASPEFEVREIDVTSTAAETVDRWAPGRVDAVAHLASPASPPDYQRRPLQTLAAGSRGTENALRLATRDGARFVLASTSEVYGDPEIHPQREDYWGNVNPIGPRSVYDEAKRFAEALTVAHARDRGLNAGIIRIFNTYGPRMRPQDGRVVSTFITQALAGEPITVYGDGSQTRSFCYVDDLIRGIVAMLDRPVLGPVNLGNPSERTVRQLADQILSLTRSTSTVEYRSLPVDDPTRRRPDITAAADVLGWRPQVSIEDGLRRTVDWFASRAKEPVELSA